VMVVAFTSSNQRRCTHKNVRSPYDFTRREFLMRED
jgi:hypothetical protein